MGEKLINLPYISLPNILMGDFVIKEFIQQDAKPDLIAVELLKLIKHPDYYNAMQEHFRTIIKMLGTEKASKNAATYIWDNI